MFFFVSVLYPLLPFFSFQVSNLANFEWATANLMMIKVCAVVFQSVLCLAASMGQSTVGGKRANKSHDFSVRQQVKQAHFQSVGLSLLSGHQTLVDYC